MQKFLSTTANVSVFQILKIHSRMNTEQYLLYSYKFHLGMQFAKQM